MFSQNDIQKRRNGRSENIHGVSLNKEVEKERKRRMFFTIYIFDKRNDSLQNNHQISFNKETKKGAQATKCVSLFV